MNPFNIHQALQDLREEIQTDRLATTQMIQSGFLSLSSKLDEESEERAKLSERVKDVETKQKTIIGTCVAVLTAGLGTFGAWIVGK